MSFKDLNKKIQEQIRNSKNDRTSSEEQDFFKLALKQMNKLEPKETKLRRKSMRNLKESKVMDEKVKEKYEKMQELIKEQILIDYKNKKKELYDK